MNKTHSITFILFIFFGLTHTNVLAQSGTITYEKIVDYGLEGAFDHPKWDMFIADLPKQGKEIYTLAFNQNFARYQEDQTQRQAMPENLRGALGKANYGKPPKQTLKTVYYDFSKGKKIEEVEFMTRSFLIESDLSPLAWKLTQRKKKVQDYICIGAELQNEDETITAWFTAEITSSVGPNSYHGLPGIILALEKNGEIFVLATSINLTIPTQESLKAPQKGQKMSQKAFDQIVEEKIQEFHQEMKNKKKQNGKSK